MVRDCRHVETAEGIIHEIEKHLTLATAGTNLQVRQFLHGDW